MKAIFQSLKPYLGKNLAATNLLVGGVGIIFSFLLPILTRCKLCNFSSLNHSAYAQSLLLIDIRISGVALFVAACPMALDLIMDVFSAVNGSNEFSNETHRKCWISRVIVTITTLLVGLQVALGYDYFNLPVEYVISFRFALWSLIITSATCFLFCLSTANPTIFTVFQTAAFSFITTLYAFLKFISGTAASDSVHMSTLIVSYVWFIFIFVMIVYWVYQLWRLKKSWSIDDYTCIFYMFLLILTMSSMLSNLVYSWVLNTSYYVVHSTHPINLLVPIYLQTACAVLMSIVPGRIARIEAIISKDNVIETKQAYVRYISHELRTPLNTVYMGLTLSIDQIPPDTNDPIEQERRSTLQEVWCACEVALDILNDLLLYDKVQLHLVGLTKEKLIVVDFMTQCINMFSVQLRLKKLQLTLFCDGSISKQSDNCDADGNIQTHVKNHCGSHHNIPSEPLLLDDVIDADKSKLSQVVRNLLSNAIKFTPEGGDIQVSVSFLPLYYSDGINNSGKFFYRSTSHIFSNQIQQTLRRQSVENQENSVEQQNIMSNLDRDQVNGYTSTSSVHQKLTSMFRSAAGISHVAQNVLSRFSSLSTSFFLLTHSITAILARFLNHVALNTQSNFININGNVSNSSSISPNDDLTISGYKLTYSSHNDHPINTCDTTAHDLSASFVRVSHITEGALQAAFNIHESSHNKIEDDDRTKFHLLSGLGPSFDSELFDIEAGLQSDNIMKETHPYDIKNANHEQPGSTLEIQSEPHTHEQLVAGLSNINVKRAMSISKHNDRQSGLTNVSEYNTNSILDAHHHQDVADCHSENNEEKEEVLIHQVCNGMLVIEVKDSGVGISLEDQERLFKEIIQFKPEVLQGGGGSGLGLFITKGIVDLHGGQISVHSEGEGKGTTIHLELPMSRTVTKPVPKNIVAGSEYSYSLSDLIGLRGSKHKRANQSVKCQEDLPRRSSMLSSPNHGITVGDNHDYGVISKDGNAIAKVAGVASHHSASVISSNPIIGVGKTNLSSVHKNDSKNSLPELALKLSLKPLPPCATSRLSSSFSLLSSEKRVLSEWNFKENKDKDSNSSNSSWRVSPRFTVKEPCMTHRSVSSIGDENSLHSGECGSQ